MMVNDEDANLREDLADKITAAQDLAIKVAMSPCVSEKLAWAARFSKLCRQDVDKLRRL